MALGAAFGNTVSKNIGTMKFTQEQLEQINKWASIYLPISDITSEISDSAKDLVHIKFSWRFEDNSIWLDEDRYPQVFSAPYNDTFK